jgi:hypothetical protein
MDYILFYTGLASTPFTVGLKCITTNEVVCEIDVMLPSGKATRVRYEKMVSKLKRVYKHLLK